MRRRRRERPFSKWSRTVWSHERPKADRRAAYRTRTRDVRGRLGTPEAAGGPTSHAGAKRRNTGHRGANGWHSTRYGTNVQRRIPWPLMPDDVMALNRAAVRDKRDKRGKSGKCGKCSNYGKRGRWREMRDKRGKSARHTPFRAFRAFRAPSLTCRQRAQDCDERAVAVLWGGQAHPEVAGHPNGRSRVARRNTAQQGANGAKTSGCAEISGPPWPLFFEGATVPQSL